MYAIYSDGDLLYAPNMTDLGYICTGPKVTMELNKAGSLEFTIPYTNPNYNAYSKLKSIISVEQDGSTIWRGRVLDDTKDIYLNKDVMCEGELAFLNDEMVRPYTYNGVNGLHNTFRAIMNVYSNNCSDYRMIRAGNITVTNASFQPSIEDPNSCLGELTDQLVGAVGGYLVLRRSNGVSYLDWIDDFDQTSNQVIEFGRNMVDLEEYIDASEVYTVLIPFGKKDDDGNRLTIESVNGGKDWIQSDQGINLFGHITQAVSWDDVENPSELLTNARSLLNDSIQMATTITINAVDLHLLDVNTDSIALGDFVHVISAPHGIDSQFLCSKIVIDLQNPDRTEYTFGLAFDALTDQQVASNKKLQNSYSLAQSTSDAFNSIKNQQYQNLVYKAEFNSAIQNLQNQINGISAPDLSDYLTKSDAADIYATNADLTDLESRVSALEEISNGGN